MPITGSNGTSDPPKVSSSLLVALLVALGAAGLIGAGVANNPTTTPGDLIVRGDAGVLARLGTSGATDGGVLTVAGGAVQWATPSGGASHTSGTLAARPASPGAGDTYKVTSGAATGDVYACDVAGSWRVVSYDRTPAYLSPTLLWLASETSGTTLASTGSNTSVSLTATASSLGAQGERATSYAVLATSARAVSGDGAFIPSSTRRLTLSVAVQLLPGATLNGYGFGFRQSTGPRRHMVYFDGNGLACAYLATSTSETTMNGHTANIDGIVDAGTQRLVHLVWDGDASPKATIYVDGRAIATSTPSDTDLVYGSADRYWIIGALPGFGNGVAARYAHAAVWDGTALTAAQVREHAQRFRGIYGGQ